MALETTTQQEKLIQPLTLPKVRFTARQLESLAVLHQLCKIMVSVSNHGALHRHVADQLGREPLALAVENRVAFEQRRLMERHQVLEFGLWLLAKPKKRLRQAWEAKAVRYNQLVKDFEGVPGWFEGIVAGMNRGWRAG